MSRFLRVAAVEEGDRLRRGIGLSQGSASDRDTMGSHLPSGRRYVR